MNPTLSHRAAEVVRCGLPRPSRGTARSGLVGRHGWLVLTWFIALTGPMNTNGVRNC